jgi:hypothetical protein
MKKCQVVLWLFVPAYKQPTKAVHPGMRSFHHPTARFEPGLLFDGSGLFSSWAYMGGKAECVQDVAHLLVVIPFVQTHPLRVLFGWLWTLDDDAFDGRPHQFHIVAIGSLNREADGHPMPFREHAAFDATLASISGIGAGFFPRPTGLWSSPRPYSTTASQCYAVHQTAQFRLARR